MKISNKEELGKFITISKEIPHDQIKIIYENDYWDGPTEGVCLWNNEEYYFVWCGLMDEKDEIVRKFLLIRFTDDQFNMEKNEHLRFTELSKSGNLDKFYEEKESYPENTIDYSQVMGWFAD